MVSSRPSGRSIRKRERLVLMALLGEPMRRKQSAIPCVVCVELDDEAVRQCNDVFAAFRAFSVVVVRRLETATDWIPVLRPRLVIVGGVPPAAALSAISLLARGVSAGVLCLGGVGARSN
jgi:hypothetical protein